jgi:glycine/D-amino acid oxidase-like deaminating enzyme
MPSSPRYDTLVVGGGLAGSAVATLLAKRGQRVALIEPRSEWGGCFADQRVGGVTVTPGPWAVVGHERLGWADAYFEAVGLSLALLVREGATFKRDAMQLIWGPHRITLFAKREDFAEELRREYRVGDPEVAALLADLDAVYDVSAIRWDPSPTADPAPSLTRLRSLAAARAFGARFGALAPSDYVRARGLAPAFAAYLECWRAASAVNGEPAGTWLFRTALAHRGLVSLPEGRAAVCRLLVSRLQSLGGEVLRTPVAAVGAGQEPFVETDGLRITARALIINARSRPRGVAPQEPQTPPTTAVYTVPSGCVPEAMGAYLLAGDGAETWSVAKRPHENTGSALERLTVSYRGQGNGRDAQRIGDRLEEFFPFAGGQLKFAGVVGADEVPDPVDPKLLESVSWRARRSEWVQAARSPVWWVPDVSPPWFGDARDYRTALALDRAVRPT